MDFRTLPENQPSSHGNSMGNDSEITTTYPVGSRGNVPEGVVEHPAAQG